MGSDIVIVVVLLLLNIFYNFVGICVKSQIVILLNYPLFTNIFFKREGNCPNLNKLSHYYALQKYVTIPL